MGATPTLQLSPDLAHVQERALCAAATESGRYADLMFYSAVLGNAEVIARLAPDLNHPQDRLIAAMLLPERFGAADAELLALAEEADDPWVFYTLTKYFLRRNQPKQALAGATSQLKRNRQDTFCLNTIARWALQSQQWDLASHLSQRALLICGEQRDMTLTAYAAQQKITYPYEPYLEVWPQPCAVAYYLPCYNVERYILPTIEAILRQCYPLHELLIIDDASPDKTVEIASSFPVRVLRHEENKGLAAARNTAAFNSTAEYIASVDTDACPDPGYIKYAMMEFEQAGSVLAGVGGRLIEMHSDTPADHWRTVHMSQDPGKLRWYLDTFPKGRNLTDEEIQFYLTDIHFLTGSNNVFRRDAITAVGGYEERHRTNAEDVYLCRKLKHAGYHTCFAPNLRAHHNRRDTLRSLLKTAWNYAYWARTDLGFYGDILKLVDLFKDHIIFAHWHLMSDMEAERLDLLYIDELFIFHSLLLDLHHAVNEGVLSNAQALHVQESAFACVTDLDRAQGGELLQCMQNDMADLLLPQGATADLPEEAEANLRQTCVELRQLFSDYSPFMYCALLTKSSGLR